MITKMDETWVTGPIFRAEEDIPTHREPDQYSRRMENNTGRNFKRYCHYWNNSGNCTFKNCIFLHKKSPICKFDGSCNRKKCMYSHSKQDKSFLASKLRSPPSRMAWQTPPSSPRLTAPPQLRRPVPPPSLGAVISPAPPTASYWAPPAPWTHWANPWLMSGQGQMGMNSTY